MDLKQKSNKRYINIALPLIITLTIILSLTLSFNLIEEELKNSDLNLSLLNSPAETVEINFTKFLTTENYDIYDEYPTEENILDSEENIEIVEPIHKNILIDEKINNNLEKSEKSFNKELKERSKLVIIIDDISFEHQVKLAKKLNLDVTLSFLPPNSIHPNSHLVAKKSQLDYMIHLPLEAINYPKEEENTLRVGDDLTLIEKKILKAKNLFPDAIYVNNHTGSKFTADRDSVLKLLKTLKSHNLKFIDSRTTSKTQVAKVSKELNLPYIRRDIFLDNTLTIDSIRIQLKKAVSISKRKGYAIAICHPHKVTIDAIESAKDDILRDIDVVNIYRLNLLKG